MITTFTPLDRHVIDQAANLLDTTGRRSRRGDVSLHCLIAAERLVEAGATSDISVGRPSPGTEDRVLIGQALQLLGALPAEILDDDSVLDAMNYALLAHAATR